MHSGLAGGADVILVPEEKVDINLVCRRVLLGQQSGKLHSIIIKAEGVEVDSTELAKIIEERTGREARAVFPGHIQRGGAPSGRDMILTSLMATKAVQLFYNDESSKVIGIVGNGIVAYNLSDALVLKRGLSKDMYDLAEILS